MPDGLGMLDEQRQRRSRNIPSPRNRPRTTPVEIVTVPTSSAKAELAQEPVTVEPAELAPVGEGNATAPPTEPTPAARPQPTVVMEPPVKMSIYLEVGDDLYLEEITHAGKTSRPRVAISRSAIVRLALQRLAATMTADEIVTELRQRGDEHQGTGRKRR